MSQKITGKNLQYDQTLPPFLARLKGQHIADSESPDPILASRRRAAKPRSASEEAEDAPLIVDDDGNVVQGMKVGRDGTVKEEEEEEEGKETKSGEEGAGGADKEGKEVGGERAQETEKEKVAAIGGSKKRKAGKVVGADAEDEEEGDSVAKYKAATQGKGALAKLVKKGAEDKDKAPAKGKKKAKKIKLSFGDDDGD